MSVFSFPMNAGLRRMAVAAVLVLVLAVLANVRNGLWHDAVLLWGDVNAKGGAKGRSFAHLGSYYAGLGQYDKAIGNFEAAIERNPGKAKLYLELAKVYRQNNDPQGESDAYQRALLAGINDADIHAGLGDALFRQMDLAAAYREYEAALAIDKNSAHAHFKLGLIDLARRNYRSSLTHFQIAGRLDPGNADYSAYAEVAASLQGRRAKP